MKIPLEQWIEITSGQETSLFLTGIYQAGCSFYVQATNFDHQAAIFDPDEVLETYIEFDQYDTYYYVVNAEIGHTVDGNGENFKWVVEHYRSEKYRASDNELLETIIK